ncbi:MAG: AbrB/MazE/SpoVT family DNA-binding domain-containing protein [Candidatus Methylomirabilis oxygeniifera]|nr:MAG: AbrB/MazE/SpoVT family DNA-binding domain-containing protein [Candidatus Methylomirabilis oxyfera]
MLEFYENGGITMPITHLSEKGQVLIPKALRRKFGLKPGAKIQLAEEAGRLILSPVPPDPIAAATGSLEGEFSLTADLRRDHQEEIHRERKARTR